MNNQSIAVLAIGSELLDGRVLDTNTKYIAEELTNKGIPLRYSLICDDVEHDIVSSLQFLVARASIIIISGGLGPTTDDLTREAVAQFTNKNLVKSELSVERLVNLYAKRQRPLDPSNLKQAHFPEGAIPIPNDIGTAEGFHIQTDSLQIFAVPGVPKELKPMWTQYILPRIESKMSYAPLHRESFRLFGLPEAVVGSSIHALNFPKSITVSYRAHFPEIHVVIKGTDKHQVEQAAASAKAVFKTEHIFIENQDLSLPQTVCHLLSSSNLSVSVAESCTGGLLGSFLTAPPGASRYFAGGYLTYANSRKEQDLSVPHAILAAYGAVSEETAKAMASGCRAKTGTDFGVSITGIAGPDGGSDEKPVGTFFVGISSQETTTAYKYFFTSDREGIRLMATYCALEALRRQIQQI